MSVFEDLRPTLEKATLEERRVLAEILGAEIENLDPGDERLSPEGIVEKLLLSYHSFWSYTFQDKEDKSYAEIVVDVAKRLKIKWAGVSLEDIELRIVQHELEKVWDQMPPEKQEEVIEDLKEKAQKLRMAHMFAGIGGAGMFATLIAGRMSGFGVYLLATTMLGKATSVLGITVPFAAYMGAARAASLVFGPPGWIAAGLLTVAGLTLSKGNSNAVLAFVVYITLLKIKQSKSNFRLEAINV